MRSVPTPVSRQVTRRGASSPGGPQRRDEARQLLERAVQLPGASDFAHALLGQLFWEDVKGKAGLSRAEAEFQRALEQNPRFAKMHESLALVKEAGGAPADQTVPLALRAARSSRGTSAIGSR